MMTRKIIKKILPNTLPLAVLLITSTLPYQAYADGRNDNLKTPATSSPKEKTPDSANKRIKFLTYNDSEVYVIRTKYGYQTNIIFDPKEEIKTISIGNRSLWQIIPAGNRLFIRPMTDNLSTNMSLVTNKHSYEFELKSVDGDSESNIYVARFVYPDTAGFESATAAHTIFNSPAVQSNGLPAVESSELPPEAKPNAKNTAAKQQVLKLPESSIKTSAKSKKTKSTSSLNNYSYTYTGPDEIAPLQVYDDGKSTFIKYQKINAPAPSVFIIDGNGKESPISSTVKNSSLIVGGVASEMLLRSGAGEIKIYNESQNQR